MKIVLVGNYIKDNQLSMQKFSACLAQGLRQKGHEVEVCQPRALFGLPFTATTQGFAKYMGYLDKYVVFPFALRKEAKKADIIHIIDHSNSIYIPFIKKYAHLVTCHDLMAVRSALGEFAEKNPVGKTGKLQQQWILSGLKAAANLVSVSQATQQDVMRLTNQSVDNLSVIYNGLNFAFHRNEQHEALALLAEYNISENVRFLLHVGGNQWYKNRKGLVAIFKQIINQQPEIDLKLVMAGKAFSKELSDFIQMNGLKDKIIPITLPSTEVICALYSLTTAFIFPSLCEGFGWPIIEAQACGALVFTSNRQPMAEVGGNAAIFLDPEAPEKAAQIILNTLTDTKIIDKIRRNIPSNLLKFRTEIMVDKYISRYQHIALEQEKINENSAHHSLCKPGRRRPN